MQTVLADLLETFRVVHLGGARQSGKSTPANELLPHERGALVSIDDEAMLARAHWPAASAARCCGRSRRAKTTGRRRPSSSGSAMSTPGLPRAGGGTPHDRRCSRRYGPEVDVIVEDRRSGVLSGVEVKSTSTPRAEHARHLALLRDRLGDRFAVGVVLHLGAAVLPLGDRLWALPVPSLWTPW